MVSKRVEHKGGPHGLLGCADWQLPHRPWSAPQGSNSEVDALSRLGRRLASAVAFSLPLGEADGLEDDGELE